MHAMKMILIKQFCILGHIPEDRTLHHSVFRNFIKVLGQKPNVRITEWKLEDRFLGLLVHQVSVHKISFLVWWGQRSVKGKYNPKSDDATTFELGKLQLLKFHWSSHGNGLTISWMGAYVEL
jgi:hypothetical protein